VHIYRGVRHFFRNGGKDAAIAFVAFSPPFDGRDTVTAEMPAAEQPPPPAKEGQAPTAGEGGASSVGGAAGAGIATNDYEVAGVSSVDVSRSRTTRRR
jgi:hypothetical protein